MTNDNDTGRHNGEYTEDHPYYVKANEIDQYLKEGEIKATAQEEALVAMMKSRVKELNRDNEDLTKAMPHANIPDTILFDKARAQNVGEQIAYKKVAQWLQNLRA